MKRLLPIVALLLAGSAWAATVKRYVTIVTLTDDIEFIIRQTGSGNVVFSDINAQTQRTLTKDEAASLGRALLEAAGEPERISTSGCVKVPGCETLVSNPGVVLCSNGDFKP